MSDVTQTTRYQRCQALFDRAYPAFRNAGEQYADLVAARVTPQTRVLDLGCGRGSLAADALRRAGTIVGVDLSLPDLRENTLVTAPVLATGEALPFADATFDLVVSQWAVEHFRDPAPVFRELARVLRPGGEAVLFTTNAHNYVPALSRLVPEGLQETLLERLLRRPRRESFPTYFRANTARALTRLASVAGLTLESCTYIGNPFYCAFSPLAFRLALLYERFTDAPSRQKYKLYLLTVLSKAA